MIIQLFRALRSNIQGTVYIQMLQILVSGDETGLINIWCLKHGQLQILNNIEPPSDGFPVTTLCLYSKILKDGKM